MAKIKTADVVDAVREGIADLPDRGLRLVRDAADQVEEVLGTASVRGAKISKQVKKELTRRWAVTDQLARENPYYLALGALALGVVVGYLLTRDRRSDEEREEESAPARTDVERELASLEANL